MKNLREIKRKSICLIKDVVKLLLMGAGVGIVGCMLLFLCGIFLGGGYENALETAKNGIFLIAALLLFVVAGMVMRKGKKEEPSFESTGWRKHFSVIGLKMAVMLLAIAFIILGAILDYILMNS